MTIGNLLYHWMFSNRKKWEIRQIWQLEIFCIIECFQIEKKWEIRQIWQLEIFCIIECFQIEKKWEIRQIWQLEIFCIIECFQIEKKWEIQYDVWNLFVSVFKKKPFVVKLSEQQNKFYFIYLERFPFFFPVI